MHDGKTLTDTQLVAPRTAPRWCVSCMVIGVGVFAYGGLALGQVATVPAPPDLSLWLSAASAVISLLIGLVLAMVGAFVRGMGSRIDGHDDDIEALNERLRQHELMVVRDYKRTRELKEDFAKFDGKVDALHRRLDDLKIPRSTP